MKSILFVLCFFWQTVVNAQPILTGRTTGALPFLEFGPGDDRLGGAKMTYLDSGILMQVVDSLNTDYKVRLSERHFAFLPRQNFVSDTAVRVQPYYLSSSWRVWGDERNDYLLLSLPERLPYRSVQQINPARIMVDIFGLTSNTNWITQLTTAREIRNVWYEQVEDDVFRVFIELKHRQHWGYSLSYVKNGLQIRIRRQPSSLRPKKLLVAIDAGHGGSNNGATGVNSGIREKDYTLKIAQRLRKRLQCKGYNVFMTRTGDSDLGMIDRTLMLRERDPDLLVSIHLNSSGNAAIKGVSTYYRYIGFRPLSQSILHRMLQLNLSNFGNIGAFNFALSGPTEFPNCLVEVAFLSNVDDERLILDENFHRQVAKKIQKGIRDWLKEAARN